MEEPFEKHKLNYEVHLILIFYTREYLNVSTKANKNLMHMNMVIEIVTKVEFLIN